MSMESIIREEARYIALRMLVETPDYSMSDALLERALEQFGIRRGRDFVRAEMRHLEQIGAVIIKSFDATLIARLTTRGREHVEGKIILDGVKRPSPENG